MHLRFSSFSFAAFFFVIAVGSGCASHHDVCPSGASCGGGGPGGSGGSVDMASGDLAGGAIIQSGTYVTTNAVTVKDGCKVAPVLAMLPVVNDGKTLGIGPRYDSTTSPQQFNPAGYALGSGPFKGEMTAMLTLATTVTLSDNCMFARDDTAQVTILGSNMMSIDWTHRRSNYSSSCVTSDEAPMDPCVSEFKFNLGL